MPRSVFLGRIVDPGEALWTDEDRAWALALLAEEAERCSGCGHQISESMDPANEYSYRAARMRCHACTAAERQRELDKGEPGGLHVWAVRR